MSSMCWAQPADSLFHVEITSTAAPVVSFFRDPRVPGMEKNPSVGYGVFLRGMWHPGRLLSVGFITGYMVITREEIHVASSAYRVALTAAPFQIALSMQKSGLEFGMGVGPYLMMSAIEGGGRNTSHGRRFEIGMTFFGSYVFPANETIMIGPELRILYLRYRGILSVMPSFTLRLNAFSY